MIDIETILLFFTETEKKSYDFSVRNKCSIFVSADKALDLSCYYEVRKGIFYTFPDTIIVFFLDSNFRKKNGNVPYARTICHLQINVFLKRSVFI